MALVLKPHDHAQFNPVKASIVIDRIVITPLFPEGFCFPGASGMAQVIGHGQEVTGEDDQTQITYPTYTVRVADGTTVTARTGHIVSKLTPQDVAKFTPEVLGIVSVDNLDFIVKQDEVEQLVEPKLRRFYLDSYGWGVHEIIMSASRRMIMHLDSRPVFITSAFGTCATCGALRRLRNPDTVTGDSASQMYSTGTWDKTGPNKNNIHCSWLGDAQPEWERACQIKNKAFSREERRPEIWLDECGTKCQQYYSGNDISLAAFNVQEDKKAGCLFIEAPGWDVEVYI